MSIKIDTVDSHQKLQATIAAQVEEFFARGGKVQHIPEGECTLSTTEKVVKTFFRGESDGQDDFDDAHSFESNDPQDNGGVLIA